MAGKLKGASFLPVVLLLALSLPGVAVAATPTPQATETIGPTITPFVPGSCQATSIIPTVVIGTPDPSEVGTPEPSFLISPEGHLSTWDNEFTWTSQGPFMSHWLEVQTVGGDAVLWEYVDQQYSDGTYFQIHPSTTSELPDGDYKWRVVADIQSPWMYFDIGGEETPTPTATPAGGCMTSGITFGTPYIWDGDIDPGNETVASFSYVCGIVGNVISCMGDFQTIRTDWDGDHLVRLVMPVFGLSGDLIYYSRVWSTFDAHGGGMEIPGWTNNLRMAYSIPGGGYWRDGVEPLPWETTENHTDVEMLVLAPIVGGGDVGSTRTWTFHYTVSVNGNCLNETPVPTATATPSCGAGSVVEPGEPIASFNPPTFASLGCYMIFSPVSLDLPDLSWSPLDLPPAVSFGGWQICLQSVTFAAVFAGVDWVAILAGVVTFMSIGGIYQVLKVQ